MIVLSKREKETLREISQWSCFYANWKPKTRAKLEQMNLVANVCLLYTSDAADD